METFNVAVPYEIERGIQYTTLITEFESGKEQRRSKGVPRRTWTMRFSRLKAEAEQIWAFYCARRGAYEAFYWTDPLDGVTYTVRFADDNLTQKGLFDCVYEYGLRLIEVV